MKKKAKLSKVFKVKIPLTELRDVLHSGMDSYWLTVESYDDDDSNNGTKKKDDNNGESWIGKICARCGRHWDSFYTYIESCFLQQNTDEENERWRHALDGASHEDELVWNAITSFVWKGGSVPYGINGIVRCEINDMVRACNSLLTRYAEDPSQCWYQIGDIYVFISEMEENMAPKKLKIIVVDDGGWSCC